MAKTKQGAFPITYHHIEAPTVQDDELWEKSHKRKLIVPTDDSPSKIWRNPLVGYLSDNVWTYRRKLDGENIRIYWDGNQALWNGKTDAFNCNAQFTEYMNNTFLEEIFEEKFGREKGVLIFGEKMGPKSQGNELGLDHEEVIIYDVCINGFWLTPFAVADVAKYFHLHTCYDFMGDIRDFLVEGPLTLNGVIWGVSEGKYADWEGIVAVPLCECQDQHGHRVIVKIKNKDYLREN